ncbi:MAG: lysophospholipid acyltransferase family protein, partial [Desulfobacca sp.]|uniref:lysophospholipid acyltransferase family protein n=1 Tax=Desulfobacca sp. TaxID=2067990 RepID=UPI0040498490
IIFVYNHNNYFETVVLSSYFLSRWRRRISFMVDWMYGHIPILGWLLQGVEPVYVYNKPARWDFLNRRRGKVTSDPVAECLARLAQGWCLGIFPEGSRNRHPSVLKRGRQGIGEIALRSQVPVLPVGIDFPSRRQCGRIPAFGRIILRFGEPLYFTPEITAWRQAQEDVTLSLAAKDRVRLYLSRRITHIVMQELARLSGKHYPCRQPESLALGPT